MHMKISSAKWRPFCPGGDGLIQFSYRGHGVSLACVWRPVMLDWSFPPGPVTMDDICPGCMWTWWPAECDLMRWWIKLGCHVQVSLLMSAMLLSTIRLTLKSTILFWCLLYTIWWYLYWLNHWGRVKHISVSKLTSFGSHNGLSPVQRQAIIWTNAGILLTWPLGTNFSEILIKIVAFSFKKMRLKVSSAKWRPCCLSLNVLMVWLLACHPFRPSYLLHSWNYIKKIIAEMKSERVPPVSVLMNQ